MTDEEFRTLERDAEAAAPELFRWLKAALDRMDPEKFTATTMPKSAAEAARDDQIRAVSRALLDLASRVNPADPDHRIRALTAWELKTRLENAGCISSWIPSP